MLVMHTINEDMNNKLLNNFVLKVSVIDTVGVPTSTLVSQSVSQTVMTLKICCCSTSHHLAIILPSSSHHLAII